MSWYSNGLFLVIWKILSVFYVQALRALYTAPETVPLSGVLERPFPNLWLIFFSLMVFWWSEVVNVLQFIHLFLLLLFVLFNKSFPDLQPHSLMLSSKSFHVYISNLPWRMCNCQVLYHCHACSITAFGVSPGTVSIEVSLQVSVLFSCQSRIVLIAVSWSPGIW